MKIAMRGGVSFRLSVMSGAYMNEDKVYGVRMVREHVYNSVELFVVSIGSNMNIVFVGGEWTHVSFWFMRQRLQSRGIVLFRILCLQ